MVILSGAYVSDANPPMSDSFFMSSLAPVPHLLLIPLLLFAIMAVDKK